MSPFRHVSPAFRMYYGAESLQHLPAELNRLACCRAVVFCGQTLAHHTDGVRIVSEALGDRCAGVFDGVKAHSPLPAVLAGVKVLRTLKADAVIAVGGGSAIVTARASSILLAEARDIRELCTQFPSGKPPLSPKLEQPKLPQFVVATTPTTAYAPTGLTSALAHCVGARFHLDNGITNAVLLPHAMRFNAPATVDRLSLVAEALGAPVCGSPEASVAAATCAIKKVFAKIGLPKRLRDTGVPEEALPLLATDAAADWFLHQNPRTVCGTADILEVLRAAW